MKRRLKVKAAVSPRKRKLKAKAPRPMRVKRQCTIGNNNRGVEETYKPEYVDKAFRLSMLGLTLEEMHPHFNTHKQAFDGWRERHPEFDEALKRGGIDFDGHVAVGLGRRATGYHYTEQKAFCDRDGSIHVVKLTQERPPDPVAAMMWLSNRQRARWRHSQSVDVTNSDGSFEFFTQVLVSADKNDERKFRSIIDQQPDTNMPVRQVEHDIT